MKNICCKMGLAACLLLAGWPFSSSKAGARLPFRLRGFPQPRWPLAPWQRKFQDGHGAAPKAALAGSLWLGCLHLQPLTGGGCSVSEHFFISALGCFYAVPRGCRCQKHRSSKVWDCCKFHAERQAGGGRGAQSLLLSGEEAVVNSPAIKSPRRAWLGSSGR